MSGISQASSSSEEARDSLQAEDLPEPVPPVSPLRLKILGAIAVAALLFAYLMLWWNRFLGGGSDGVIFYMAERMLAGKIPYRDFYLVVPPLSLFKFAAIITVLGDKLIAVRYVAVSERIGLALLLYAWLVRRFPVTYAVLSTFVAIVIFSGDVADAVAYYPTDAALFAIAGGLCASIYVSKDSRGKGLGFILLSGLFSALALLTKQTTGLGATCVIPALVGMYLLRTGRGLEAIRAWLTFTVGWLAPIGAFVAWLSHNHAFSPFVEQVFRSGASSKGPLLAVLARPVTSTLFVTGNLIEAGLACAIIAAVFAQKPSRSPKAKGPGTAGQVAMVVVCSASAILFGFLLSRADVEFSVLRIPQLIVSYVALFGTLTIVVHLLRNWVEGDCDHQWAEDLLLAGLSLVSAYMCSLSWTPYEPMAMPGIGMLLCLAFQRVTKGARYIIAAACVAVLSIAMATKLTRPFTWVTWNEPSVHAKRASMAVSGLEGFDLSAETGDAVGRIVRAIQSHSGPTDPVFVFPYYAQFYVLSHRNPPTFAYVHWLDVVPDGQARRDADILRKARPAVLVFMDMPATTLEEAEKVFRPASQPSGQRYMLKTIRSLAASYTLVDSVKIPGWSSNILIYARPKEQP